VIAALGLIALLAAPVTVEALVDEMADLDRLTQPADYTCRQFSSYDRASTTPDDPATWFANGDCGHYLREEQGEFVLAEAAGPGVIVRIWSANPAGEVRVYLDGKVALRADFAALLTGKVEPFEPPFGELTARGATLYFPFPYAKSMKVTTTKGGQYYHVDYRTYAAGTALETFDAPPREAMRRAAARLARCDPAGAPADETDAFAGAIDLAGPRTITRFELTKIEGDLRRATIRMSFDGEPGVFAPLGDFFGTAPGENRFRTLALGTWYCAFPMPFAKSARIEVLGAKVVGRVLSRAGAAPFRFHAWWRGRARLATRPMRDWTILRGEGRGRYVGTALFVRNPVRAWWGEGDEKVYVDGERFPSWFGTGTEDYFGYAWCATDLFEHAYHAQSLCEGPANKGSSAVARLHVLDDIPFARAIRFDLEVWHWADCEVGWATIAYWYAEPGFHGALEEAPDAERELIAVPPPRAVAGAIEGESLAVLEQTGGVAERQDMEIFGEGWSGGAHLWWRGARPGDRLKLAFAAKGAGRRKVFLAMTKAPDYGIVRISVNGEVLAPAFDLFSEKVEPAGERTFDADLVDGANTLELEIVGTNPRARPQNFMFGLDYLRIEEAHTSRRRAGF
jgi:hypothetical protein